MISDKVFEEIHKKNIKPESIIYIRLKKFFVISSVTILFFLCTIFIGLSYELSIFNDVIDFNKFGLLFNSIPWFFVIFSLITFAFVVYEIKNINNSYRYSFLIRTLIVLLISFLIIILCLFFNFFEKIERKIFNRIPGYDFFSPKEMMNSGKRGILRGEVLEKKGNILIIKNKRHNHIEIININNLDFEIIPTSSEVKFLGKKSGIDYFEANDFIILK